MSNSSQPIPEVSPETEEFWAAAREHKLLLCHCEDCELIYYYPRALCPDCFSDNVSWHESDGHGSVYTYTVSHQMSNWPDEFLPLILAYVELQEGPRILTNIVGCTPEEMTVGMEVEIAFESREDFEIPVFKPVD